MMSDMENAKKEKAKGLFALLIVYLLALALGVGMFLLLKDHLPVPVNILLCDVAATTNPPTESGSSGSGKCRGWYGLVFRSGIEKAPLGFRVAGAEEISRQTEPRKRRPLETYLGVSKLGLAR